MEIIIDDFFSVLNAKKSYLIFSDTKISNSLQYAMTSFNGYKPVGSYYTIEDKVLIPISNQLLKDDRSYDAILCFIKHGTKWKPVSSYYNFQLESLMEKAKLQKGASLAEVILPVQSPNSVGPIPTKYGRVNIISKLHENKISNEISFMANSSIAAGHMQLV